MLTLPSGIKKYQATDNATVDNFNVNVDLIDAKITELNAHGAATTAVHGSTSAATANRLIQRDSAGRAKIAAPAASDDIARKDNVDAVQASLTAHVGIGGTAHAVATPTTAGFESAADKAKLDGIAAGANNYVHPAGDGNQHVPATGTTNNGKVLKAASTAGSSAWGLVSFSEIASKPTTLSGYGITDTVKTRLNGGALEFWNGTGWIPVGGNMTYVQSNNIQYNDATTRTLSLGLNQTLSMLVYAWTPSYDGFITVTADLTSTNGQGAWLAAGSWTMGRFITNGQSGPIGATTGDNSTLTPTFNKNTPAGTIVTLPGTIGLFTSTTLPGNAPVSTSTTTTGTANGQLAVFAGVTVYFILRGTSNSGQNGPATLKNLQLKYDKVVSD